MLSIPSKKSLYLLNIQFPTRCSMREMPGDPRSAVRECARWSSSEEVSLAQGQ